MSSLAYLQDQVSYFEVGENELDFNSYLNFPQLRYMGSKFKLLPWIEQVLSRYEYNSVLDAFSGSGSVSFMFKKLGKKVTSNDFLRFSSILTKAFIENSEATIQKSDLEMLLKPNPKAKKFIQETFKDIFFQADDLIFLDNISTNISLLNDEYKKSLAYAALFRSCVKKQPRGVFTISGTLEKYNDGRRDLRLSLRDHFIEQIDVYNSIVFNNGNDNICINKDVFEIDENKYASDLVYLDPPYVPLADDNCYVKRYHFLEGLSDYWVNEEILQETKVKKIKKKFTAFSYRKTADEAFLMLFDKFKNSKIALSYSSNAYPDLDGLVTILGKTKKKIDVFKKEHRYHFGTHKSVKRSVVDEYLIIGT